MNDDGVEVLRFAGHRMIRGPTRQAVLFKLAELVQSGANVVLGPRKIGDQWVAVCDCDETFYKW